MEHKINKLQPLNKRENTLNGIKSLYLIIKVKMKLSLLYKYYKFNN